MGHAERTASVWSEGLNRWLPWEPCFQKEDKKDNREAKIPTGSCSRSHGKPLIRWDLETPKWKEYFASLCSKSNYWAPTTHEALFLTLRLCFQLGKLSKCIVTNEVLADRGWEEEGRQWRLRWKRGNSYSLLRKWKIQARVLGCMDGA